MTAPVAPRPRRISDVSRGARLAARPVPPRPVPCDPWSGRVRGRGPESGPAHLLAAFLVTLTVVGVLGWLGEPASPGPEPVPNGTAVVRVGAGETVWDVARRVAPEADPRAVVERIYDLNGVSSAVHPGQRLQVPASS